MPRANRCILPGYIYHMTHRCHDRKFLLRARIDRIEYWHRLRENMHKYRISLFNYCITCNHVHLIATSKRLQDISRFMQRQEGGFADYYNLRKNRSGSFWGERFHCTMIEDNEHLWNCLRYVDLNMVRAGVVAHPGMWPWCGYRELVGEKKRYRLLDMDGLVERLGLKDREMLSEVHRQQVHEALESSRLKREAVWTESIAVGSDSFLKDIASKNKSRKRLHISTTLDGTSYIKESPYPYARKA